MSGESRYRIERLFTPEEYLLLERAANFKSEYVAGKIYAMARVSKEHNLITASVIAELHGQLRGRNCGTYPSDMRVKVGETGLYAYPDVSVVCGEAEYLDQRGDVLLNPTVIVEVMSPSTEDYDRGEKAKYYRQIASLTDYILIAQDQRWIEHYARRSDSQWALSEVALPNDEVVLASIGCTLRFDDIYRQVPMTPPSRPGP